MAQQRDFGAVLDEAKAGEQWAVAILFNDLQPRLLRYLRSRNRDLADDIAADVWEAIRGASETSKATTPTSEAGRSRSHGGA